jgi:hypothetical protein
MFSEEPLPIALILLKLLFNLGIILEYPPDILLINAILIPLSSPLISLKICKDTDPTPAPLAYINIKELSPEDTSTQSPVKSTDCPVAKNQVFISADSE